MKSVNKVILIGRLGKDPEKKSYDSKTRATFSMATSESYKRPDGEYKEETQWHNIVVWGQSAEYAGNHLKKGDVVYVEGKITHRSYIDSNDVTKYVTEIVATNVSLFDRYKPNQAPAENPGENNTQSNDSSDELPF